MAEYIDREKAILALLEKGQHSKRYKIGEKWELNFDEIREAIKAIPSADVVERKHGKWIGIPHKTVSKRNRTIHSMVYICPLCRYSNGRRKSNFCPNCGADMRDANNA